MDENKTNELCIMCKNCRDVNSNSDFSQCDTESCISKCTKWLENCNIMDDISDTNSEISCDKSSSISETTDTTEGSENIVCQDGETIISISSGVIDDFQISSNNYKHIKMSNCKNIHMGNITKIYGPVQVNRSVTNTTQVYATNNIFLGGIAKTFSTKKLTMVDRKDWLAQPPVEPVQSLPAPAKLVIISHTATESGLTQAENVLHTRTIQTFHIESRKWNDIAYNFLVGCDGKVYKGRGWGVVGAHTLGYNTRAIGISFIGCFLTTLPTDSALHQAKTLIEHGVEIGEIDANYVLLGHCQCCPTESPGRKLFEEIQTWDHWSDIVPE